jgi:AraC family transcriptional regulator of adaptative response/methylated-DNA-[protein]-cysteine methyltransferase
MKLTNKLMYNALVGKDSAFEGIFFAAVKTTRIFCRPTCPARKPKPENVEYFSNPKDAMLNGYRPCKICKPLELPGSTPEFIKNLLQKIESNPYQRIKDYDMRMIKIEPNKVRRWFKTNHGLTFQGYQRMMRINSAFQQLSLNDTVTNAAFDNGYESVSGFTEAYKSVIGNNPSDAKYSNVINLLRFSTPLGPMISCATVDGICLVEFTDRRMLEAELNQLKKIFKARIIFGSNPHFTVLEKQMKEYFEGTRKQFELPLLTPGSEFQNKVWKQLLQISYGSTCSYKSLAIQLKNQNAVRAVARANGSNRIAIIIPCHRVIGEDGSLTGYSGGLSRKKWLIDFEKNNSVK